MRPRLSQSAAFPSLIPLVAGFTFAAALILIATIATNATALEVLPERGKAEGWTRSAALGANISFTSNQNVIGQTDGEADTFGANLRGVFDHNVAADEWRTETSYLGSLSKTPVIPRFVKSSDELKLSTIYMHSAWFKPELGPYVRASAAAPIFKGEDVRSGSQTYRLSREGASDQVFSAGSARLTDPFKPLTTKEGAGVFWKAVTQPSLQVEARLGISAMQINADGQLNVTGTNAAGEVLLTELQSVSQGGPEAGVQVRGKIDDKSAYEAGADAMIPYFNNKSAADSRDPVALTNLEAYARLTSHIVSWASFSYDYKIKIEPQLMDRAQQIQLLVLSVNYDLF